MTTRSAPRKVSADLLTTLGWLNGTLHVPSHLSLEEHLAGGSDQLIVTGVAVPNEPDRLRFVALRRNAVLVVAPALPEEREDPEAEFSTAREVACLLPGSMLRGTLRVLHHLRLSDHLRQASQLLTLRHCLLAPYGATANSPGARTLHTAVVNLSHVVGVSEQA